eukprot:scaffold82154_cov33-Tisochrysis_lutea.AAC.2
MLHLVDGARRLHRRCVQFGWQGHAVEVGTSGRGVRAHVRKIQPLADRDIGKCSVGHDTVKAVASGTPDGGRPTRPKGRIGVREGMAISIGSGRDVDILDDVVVIQDAVERAVDAVIDVVHRTHAANCCRVCHLLLPDDVDSECVCCCGHIAARLRNDAHATRGGEG